MEHLQVYKPLEIITYIVSGIEFSLDAMRLPKDNSVSSGISSDLKLAAKLVKNGDEHGKAIRGCIVHMKMKCQVGWLLEYLTYTVGVDCLSSSSTMHNELLHLHGAELANIKQLGLSTKVYIRAEMLSYQTLRRIYLQRKYHKHPDFKIYCSWIEKLPYFTDLIYPEYGA